MFAIKDEDLEPLIARELASSKVQHEERFKDTDEAKEILRSELKEAKYEIYSTLSFHPCNNYQLYYPNNKKYSCAECHEATNMAIKALKGGVNSRKTKTD